MALLIPSPLTRRRVRLLGTVLILAAVVLLSGSFLVSGVAPVSADPAAAPAAAAAVRLDQANLPPSNVAYYVVQGQNLNVNVLIDNPQNVGGFEYDLNYDSTFLTHVSTTDGGFFTGSGRGLIPLAWFSGGNPLVGTNKVSFAIGTCPVADCTGGTGQTRVDTGPGNGTGTGTLAIATFRGVTSTVGLSTLGLANILVVHPDGTTLITSTLGTTATVAVGTFADSPANDAYYWAWKFIEAIKSAGVTAGCGGTPPNFCPGANVLRREMATFMTRAGGWTPVPATNEPHFSDVPEDPSDPNYWATTFIKTAWANGVQLPCATSPTLMFCPANEIPRREMSRWIVMTQHQAHPSDPSWDVTQHTYQGYFADIPSLDPDAAYIELMYEHGVTAGCSVSPRNYCPEGKVSRREMAIFLYRAFGLPTVIP